MSADLAVEQNPYASPAITETLAVVPGEYEFIGERIVGPSPIVLPECCVKCGEDAETGKRLKKTMKWVPIWVYFLFLVHPVVFLIAFLLMYKRGKVEYSLCEACNANRWLKMKVAWLLGSMACICNLPFILLPFYIIYSAKYLNQMPLLPSQPILISATVINVVLILGTGIAGFFAIAPIKAKSYQKPVFHLGGAKPAFFEAMARRKPSSEPAILAEEDS